MDHFKKFFHIWDLGGPMHLLYCVWSWSGKNSQYRITLICSIDLYRSKLYIRFWPLFLFPISLASNALALICFFSGQLGPLIKEFGLGDDAAAAAAQGDMEAFVKALQSKEGGDKKKDDKDKEEDMALD